MDNYKKNSWKLTQQDKAYLVKGGAFDGHNCKEDYEVEVN